MATGDSIIRVSIIGDATKLTGALKTADGKIGGLTTGVKGLATGILALGAVTAGFEFVKGATEEADRLGDAAARLNAQLGTDLAGKVDAVAGSFTKLGLSKQDVEELAANFADVGTAIGIADPIIAKLAPTVVGTAQALSLLGKGDTASLVDAIGKAAGGSAKAAKTLGVTLIDTKDAGKQLDNILAQLKPQLDAATTGTADLEQKQSELGARWETLQAQIGGPLSEALASVLTFITDEIDAIPGAIEGWTLLGQTIVQFGRDVLGPLGNVRDVLQGIWDVTNAVSHIDFGISTNTGGGRLLPSGIPMSESGTAGAIRNWNNRNGTGDHGV